MFDWVLNRPLYMTILVISCTSNYTKKETWVTMTIYGWTGGFVLYQKWTQELIGSGVHSYTMATPPPIHNLSLWFKFLFFSVIWWVECYDLDIVNWRYVVLSRKMVLLYQEEWAKAAINSGETASKATLCIYDIKLK